MSITAVGARGTAAGSASATTFVVTPTSAVLVDRVLVGIIVKDNTSTTDGDNTEVLSVVDTAGNTYLKLGEYTNSPSGTAADGVTVSVWAARMASQLPLAGSVTATFAAPTADRCFTLFEFSVVPGKTLRRATANVANEVNGATNFGLVSIPDGTLPAGRQHLFLRALAKEANPGNTTFTPTAGYSTITGVRSRNNNAAVCVRGEYRIATLTGEISNPGFAVTGDTAGLFLALFEDDPAEITAAAGTISLTGHDADLIVGTGAPTTAVTQLGPLGIAQRPYGTFQAKQSTGAYDLPAEVGAVDLAGAAVAFDYDINAAAGAVQLGAPEAVLSDDQPTVQVSRLGLLATSQRLAGSVAGKAAALDIIAAAGAFTVQPDDVETELVLGQPFVIITVDDQAVGITEDLAPVELGIAPPVIYCDPGAAGWTGVDSTAEVVAPLTAGALTLTGAPAATVADYVLSADAGSVTLAGHDATLEALQPGAFAMDADPGAFAVVGPVAAIIAATVLDAESDDYTIFETAADLRQDHVFIAAAGAVTLAGADATLETTQAAGFDLTAEAGSYAVAGEDTGFAHEVILAADAGSYAVTGDDLGANAFDFTAAAGQVDLVGAETSLLANDILADLGAFLLTGGALITTVDADESMASFDLTGQPATLLADYALRADAGVLVLDGAVASVITKEPPVAVHFTAETFTRPTFTAGSVRLPRFAAETFVVGGGSS